MKLTTAVVQIGSSLFDTPATLAKVDSYVRKAAADGAKLIVLPEAIIGGYPKGLDFGVHVGSRTAAGREQYRRYAECAIDVPGPQTAMLADLAAQLGVFLVVGAIERRPGTLYCDALFFGPQGGLIGVHRKLVPTAAERFLWGYGDGSTMPAVPMGPGPAVLGAAICWENYMPLFRTAMYAKGVNVWCAPTVDDRESWLATMRHIALEGRCFVLSASQFVRRCDYPDDVYPIQGDDPNTVLIGGGSVIISPLGVVLKGPLRDGEGILTAVLDLQDVTRARFDLDVVGHYARPDIFTLSVNEDQRLPALTTNGFTLTPETATPTAGLQ